MKYSMESVLGHNLEANNQDIESTWIERLVWSVRLLCYVEKIKKP